MATFPSTISQRASYQRVVGSPAGSISCARQVNRDPSGELQCGSMRDAIQNSPATTASSSTVHTTVSIATQHARRRGWAAVAALALVGVLAACSGGGGDSASQSSTTAAVRSAGSDAPTSTAAAATTTTLSTGAADLGAPNVTGAQLTNVNGTGALDPALQTQITDAVHTYVNAASGTPLGTGQQAVLDGVLTAAAASRLTPAARDALTDEGLPALAGVTTDKANVVLDAFVGPDQTTIVVNATVDLALSAKQPGGGPVRITRNGTLTYVNDGGTWRIDAFTLNVERDIP